MANQIGMDDRAAIAGLYRQGWRKRRIARELGLDRKTVRRHIRLLERGQNPPLPPLGELGPDDPKGTLSPAGADSNSPLSPAGNDGRPSQCEPYRKAIEDALEGGLSAQRIYQDLVTNDGFGGSYDAVKRFARRLRVRAPERFHRFESPPAEEAQVDFGRGAPIRTVEGRLQKTWVFRIVLSYSRKAYSEAVLRQSTDVFIRCLENAFRYFSGATRTLVIDNLRAAVTRADWYEPELNPKVVQFCRHYGTVILPARPGRPRDKGKVESSVKYVKSNALKGRTFTSLAAENEYLLVWEQQVADRRIHGTTREQVARRFEQERGRLLPLPNSLFPCFQEARRSVHRDSHVEVARAYYEVPEEYICRQVWTRWDGRTVRVFNDRGEQIAVHAQAAPGRFQRLDQTTSRNRLLGVERSAAWLLRQAIRIGPHCGAWADAMLLNRGIEGVRPLQGLLKLARRHAARELERVCEQALAEGRYRVRDLRRLLAQPDAQETFSFLEQHPLIRDIAEYGTFLRSMYPEEEINKHEEAS